MQTNKEIQDRLKKAQKDFDTVLNAVLGMRMTSERWDQLFGIILRAEKENLCLDAVSPMSMYNFTQWKKRQGIV